MRKVLIIKTGYSEFLDRGISTTVSLGDVLSCTAILHLYKNDQVTWVTSWAARQLLGNNPFIKELLIFGPATLKRISNSSYDILVNLEKDIGICTSLSELKVKERFGFYFSEQLHDISTHNRSARFLLSGQENHKDINKIIFEILYETVGKKWNGESLILGQTSRKKMRYDVGFNYSVGTKWPTKAWPMEKWKELKKNLEGDFSVSWQQGHKNIKKYIEWIDSCRLIVASDSLGQVIGQALGKQVISLYGPTNYRRLQGVKNITIIPSTLKCPYLPCYLPVCKFDKFCMDYISPKKVAQTCKELLS